MRDSRNSGKFPLEAAYRFMAAHGLGREAETIHLNRVQLLSYTSTIKRGKVIELLERNGLLEEFFSSEWPRGFTDRGRQEVQRCIRVYRRFLAPGGEDASESEEGDVLKAPRQIRHNPFEVLGIDPDAEAEVIAAAYRALARKYHPDVNRSLPSDDALARMSELNWAQDELERDLTGWRNRMRSAGTGE